MAAIENVVDNWGPQPYDKIDIFNVGAKVGRGEPNKRGDVLVVQSLLFYYKKFHDFAPFIIMGRPNGKCDEALIQLIAYYQGHMNADSFTAGFSLTVDGKVGRAKGKTMWAKGKPWTIASLNNSCKMARAVRVGGDGEDYMRDVRLRYPEIEPALLGLA